MNKQEYKEACILIDELKKAFTICMEHMDDVTLTEEEAEAVNEVAKETIGGRYRYSSDKKLQNNTDSEIENFLSNACMAMHDVVASNKTIDSLLNVAKAGRSPLAGMPQLFQEHTLLVEDPFFDTYRFRNPAEVAMTHFQGNFEMYEAAVDPMHVLEEAAQSVDEPYRELAEAMRETEEPFLKLQGSMQQDESV